MNANEPLAYRMSPKTLEDYVGQEEILGQDKILYRTIKADRLSSIILWGPPGCGKTSLARVISNTTKYKFTKGNTKRIIVNSNRISSIGKTSTYSLYKWNVCNLTIRGLIHQILSDSDSPLSLDEIVSILKIKGRNTNKKNISTSIKSADKYNFIRLGSGLYGLSTKQYSDS